MQANPGELVRAIDFSCSAGQIDSEYAKIDHQHDLSSGLMYKLSRNMDSNMVDNPEFILSKRLFPTGLGGFPVDRWNHGAAGTAVGNMANSTSVIPDALDITHAGSITITTADASIAAGDYYQLVQAIEGYIFAVAKFGTTKPRDIVVSFWVRAAVAGTYCFSIRNSAATRSFVREYTVDTANTWKLITFKIPGDNTGTWLTNTSAGAVLTWALSCGSTFQTTAGAWAAGNFIGSSNQTNLTATIGNTFYITGVKVELDNYTPYQKRNLIVEDINCKRYLQVYNDPPLRGVVSSATNISRAAMVLPVEMRATPTVTTAGTGSNVFDGSVTPLITAIPGQYNTTKSIELDLTAGAGGLTVGRAACIYYVGNTTWYVSAEI